MSTKTPLPWTKLDTTLNSFGEWLILACIACISLPPAIALLGLAGLIWFFVTRVDSLTEPEFEEWHALKKKEKLTLDEQKKLSAYNYHLHSYPPKRNTKPFDVASKVLIATVLYLAIRSLYLISNSKSIEIIF